MVRLGLWNTLTSLPNPCDPTYSSSVSCFHCSADSHCKVLISVYSLSQSLSHKLPAYVKQARLVTSDMWH